MIYLRTFVQNPFWKVRVLPQEHTTYYYKAVKLTQHKNFEIQISKFDTADLFDITMDLRWWGRDHAGPELDINILGYSFNVKIYDGRHWDHDLHTWKSDPTPVKE